MHSIRFRLTAYLVAGIGLLIVLATIVLRVNLTRWMERDFDKALETQARALATLTKQEQGEVELDFADEFMPEFESAKDPHYFELWLDTGTLLERSNSFDLDPPGSRAALPREPALAARPRFRDTPLPDGRPGRLVRIDFVPQVEGPDDSSAADGEAASEDEVPRDPTTIRPGSSLHAATILVARERASLDAHINQLHWSLVGFTGLLLVTLVGIVAVALRSGLRPLDNLALQVRSLQAETLDRQLDVGALPRELRPVMDQFVGLLARVEAAFRRERQLTSDIAHELKTPIAELRTLCEVGARWPDDTEMAQGFFEDAGQIALQMERVVAQLRTLARYDEGAQRVRPGRLRLDEALEEIWKPLAKQAGEKRLRLESRVPAGTEIETDPDKFRLILANLLDNAVSYSRPGTAIVCGFESSNGHSSLKVSNCPADLESGDLPLIFDRFWRKDPARTGGRNVGLGLPIVRAFSDLLGFEIDTRLDENRLQITLSKQV